MKALRTIKKWATLSLLSSFMICCSKSEFLNVKPSEDMAVPRTVEHFLAMMDSDALMNGAGNFSPLYPAVPEWASDDVWIPEARFVANVTELHRAVYTWNVSPYPATTMQEWDKPYGIILNCNVALEGLERIKGEQKDLTAWNMVRGMALFNRSHAYSMLLYMFAPVYDSENAELQVGVPIRRTSDLSEHIVFASLEEGYNRILIDLKEAVDLLPMDPLYKTRPSKRSCWALLSRVYLWMSHFEQSNYYSDLSLKANDDLLDYNAYSTTTNYPFPRFNAEVIFNCNMNTSFSNQMRIDTNLYKSYEPNDLRRVLFYKAQSDVGHRFLGNYDGTTYVFAGLANDELYLNRAETYARLGEIDLGMADLNKLLQTRYRKVNGISTFVPFIVTEQEQAINLILQERRKQLVWRGLRWMDLKRLNQEPARRIVLTREIGNNAFELKPEDPRYVFPVPDPVADLNPNLRK